VAPVLLKVSDLFCERDERTLFENLSLELASGQILHIKGKNGSGKTSLLRILCGLYQGYEGSVEFLGESIANDRDAFNRSLLYIGHSVSVKQALTARENLTWYAKIQPQLDVQLIEQALSDVGLLGYEDVQCHQLSAGQKRRVNLARLFMFNDADIAHSVWILDEPFTAIDVDGVQKLEQQIVKYVKHGGAVILTTHQNLDIETLEQLNLDNWGT